MLMSLRAVSVAIAEAVRDWLQREWFIWVLNNGIGIL
jgi:hypothetical protein